MNRNSGWLKMFGKAILFATILIMLFIPYFALDSQFHILAYNDPILTYLTIGLIMLGLFGSFFNYSKKSSDKLSIFVLMIVTSSILLMHANSISAGVYGVDSQSEYRLTTNILSIGFHKVTESQLTSSINSFTLPAIICMLIGLELVNYYRFFIPIIYSLIPLFLYLVYKSLFKRDTLLKKYIGMVSILPFIVVFHTTFIHTLLSSPRQALGFIQFTLILYFLIRKSDKTAFSELISFILSSTGLVFSHYASFFLYMVFIVAITIIKYLSRKVFKCDFHPSINILYIITPAILGFLWYVYTRASIGLLENIQEALLRLLSFEEVVRYAEPIIPVKYGFLNMRSLMNLIINGTLALGLLYYILKLFALKNDLINSSKCIASGLPLYLTSFLVLMFILAIGPWIAKYGIGRAHLQFLEIIVPLLPLGAQMVTDIFKKVIQARIAPKMAIINILSLLIIMLSLLNSTYTTEAFQGITVSPIYSKYAFMRGYMEVNVRDLHAVKYILSHDSSSRIITDYFGDLPFCSVQTYYSIYSLHNDLYGIYNYEHRLIFLRYFNIVSQNTFSYTKGVVPLNNYCDKLLIGSLIYNNDAELLIY
jgi:uncharacterized membrane protein